MDFARTISHFAMRVRAALLVLTLMGASADGAQPAALPTPPEYFGLIMHRLDSGTPWPPFKFGSWRMWDAYVGWPDVEPKQGEWNFKRLNLYVAAAQAKGVEIVYPLGMAAPWASARPAEPSGYKPGYAAEPRDLETWRTYVRTVAEQYKGRIHYYEIWNEPSDKTYFSGPPETMVQMMRIAYETLKKVDPTIQVIGPGVTGAGRHLEYLDKLLAMGGKDFIDILGHHFYVPRESPEAMLPLIHEVQRIMRKNGISNKPLWNTETGWWIGNLDGTPDHPMVAKGGWRKVDATEEAGAYVLRAFVLARAERIDRFFWYSWDNQYGLGMRDPTSGNPKPMAKAYGIAVDWLTGWQVGACSEINGRWVCQLDRPGGDQRWIAWYVGDGQDWAMPTTVRANRLTSMQGDTAPVTSGQKIRLTQSPVLLEIVR